ncbi:MAG: LacI family DNA-binding transcriptional regulator [Candidatus Microbacterium phytovorans]|uniref:LacI family DNA-binding transcriptional regulator n=1 Tax=Candidatus Microbacterium phytovorans TaxID=3121374 RepID=A0AAJ6B560_9MICO|nr:LacI family DNA-binding transcriptional regulator [Microbacterium sp.]WEK13491.1 MAG: LacI family DNA-binding transcriptional regulator [Microbacterium sp.]
MPSRPTLAAVAAACGVSVATASRALRGIGEMSPDTRRRVAREAQRMGYDRAQTARGRPGRRADTLLDLVLSHVDGAWADEVIAGARAESTRLGFDLVLTAEREDPDDDWPERLRARRPPAAILGLLQPTDRQLAAVSAVGIPVVLLDPRGEPRHPLPSVRSTDPTGVQDAARLLLDRGVHRILVVEGAPSYRFGRDRVAGFLGGLTAAGTIRAAVVPGAAGVPDGAGLPTVERVRASWGADQAREAARPALARAAADGVVVGVFACSDEMAVGVYRAAADTGLVVGRDVLVVGFDDIPAAAWLSPPLTTVRQPIREMAAAAVRTAAAIVDATPASAGDSEFPTRLVRRGSA